MVLFIEFILTIIRMNKLEKKNDWFTFTFIWRRI
jgi:hypothetical protein